MKRWKSGRAAGHHGRTPKSKSTQPCNKPKLSPCATVYDEDCVGFLDSGPECSQQDLKAGPLDGGGKGGAPCSFECHGELLRRDVNKMIL